MSAPKLKPITSGKFLLHKYPGKGGWTYAVIPGVREKLKSKSGWIRVDAVIEGHDVGQVTLVPMKDKNSFMPFKAEIRKKIKREAGDTVRIVLYDVDRSLTLPEDFLLCLKSEPKALETFRSLTDHQKRTLIKNITAARTVETRVKKMAEAINGLCGHKNS
jgi:hypothetical protein